MALFGTARRLSHNSVVVAGLLSVAIAGLGCASQQRDHTSVDALVHLLPDERLGVDDVLDVKVMGEADLSGQYRVGSDGKIFFPWIGELTVQGMSPPDARALIARKLKEGYLKDPQVTVAIAQWNSRKVLIQGQVARPGAVAYGVRMTLLEAISAAGGFTPLASVNSVKIRREVSGKVLTKVYRVGDITEGRLPDVLLLPGDILLVDERMF